ncbi:hypothetical protein EVAR_55333_1 [Eumeta japonica]|uniref:Uncharacterized protein n=1 Tax=Eumeta variegata TaxID=151549 RepID=A0A4C1ZTS8_EUMVA|nr:hypothetical protein EVAR_55333_1 [Eumeta japonica]
MMRDRHGKLDMFAMHNVRQTFIGFNLSDILKVKTLILLHIITHTASLDSILGRKIDIASPRRSYRWPAFGRSPYHRRLSERDGAIQKRRIHFHLSKRTRTAPPALDAQSSAAGKTNNLSSASTIFSKNKRRQ